MEVGHIDLAPVARIAQPGFRRSLMLIAIRVRLCHARREPWDLRFFPTTPRHLFETVQNSFIALRRRVSDDEGQSFGPRRSSRSAKSVADLNFSP
jgi:hypothetical protein